MDALVVPGTLASLEVIGHYILQAAHQAGLETKAAYRLRLAVDEIATNICLYGYKEQAGKIIVQATLDDHSIHVVIEDTGPAFDPHQVKLPDVTLPPEKRALGGLGLYFVSQSVDQFLYERIEDRNRNILIVDWKQ